MDPEIVKKVGDDPRLYAVEAYLTKKGHGSTEVKFLKDKGVKYFLECMIVCYDIETGSNPEKGLNESMVAKNK